MLKYILIIIGILLIIAVVMVFYFMSSNIDLTAYQHLKNPKLGTKSSQRVIQVKAVGAPEAIVGKSFKLLYKTYYKLEGIDKSHPPAPVTRWYADASTPKEKWEAILAVPVSESVNKVPEIKDNSGLKVELATWEYGEVAEILHIGPYDKEMPAIDSLQKFIKESGYEIAGPHEEEYLKGPNPFLPTNSEKYQTIIRFQVKKAETDKAK